MNKTTMRVALVTGASSGMGKDFAKALIDQGMVVYVAARRIEKMSDLEALGAIPLKMDIADEDEIQSAAEKIKQKSRWGRRTNQQCWICHPMAPLKKQQSTKPGTNLK